MNNLLKNLINCTSNSTVEDQLYDILDEYLDDNKYSPSCYNDLNKDEKELLRVAMWAEDPCFVKEMANDCEYTDTIFIELKHGNYELANRAFMRAIDACLVKITPQYFHSYELTKPSKNDIIFSQMEE